MKGEIVLSITCVCLSIACFCNYMRASRLDDELASLKLRHKFVRDDLDGIIKNVQKLVNILAGKDGTTQDH